MINALYLLPRTYSENTELEEEYIIPDSKERDEEQSVASQFRLDDDYEQANSLPKLETVEQHEEE